MSEQIETKGKTVNAAVSEALLQLGLRRDEVEIKVLEEPKGGFLGLLGGRQARVLVRKKSDRGGSSRGRGRRRDTEMSHDLSGERSGGRGSGRDRGSRRNDGDEASGDEKRGGSRGRGSRGGRGRGSRSDQPHREDSRNRGQRNNNQGGNEAATAKSDTRRESGTKPEGGQPEAKEGGSTRRRRPRGGRGRGGRGRSEGAARVANEEQTDTSANTSPRGRTEEAPRAEDRPRATDARDRRPRRSRDRYARDEEPRNEQPRNERPRDEHPGNERAETVSPAAPEVVSVTPDPVPTPTPIPVMEREAPVAAPAPAAAPTVETSPPEAAQIEVASAPPPAIKKPRAWGGLGARLARPRPDGPIKTHDEPSPASIGAVVKPPRKKAASRVAKANVDLRGSGEENSGRKPGRSRATEGGAVVAAGILAEAYAKPVSQEGSDEIAVLNELAGGLLARAGFPCECETIADEYQRVRVTTDEESAGLLIGRHGQTVDAVEHLVERMASNVTGDRVRMNLDINQYRAQREEALTDRAARAAQDVLESGQAYSFEPMDARERRMVHMAVADIEGVETITEFDRGRKFVVIECVAASGTADEDGVNE